MIDDLTDVGKENIDPSTTRRLVYVLETLNDADELSCDLTWESEVWEGCIVEELLGGLIETENLLEREQSEDDV